MRPNITAELGRIRAEQFRAMAGPRSEPVRRGRRTDHLAAWWNPRRSVGAAVADATSEGAV